MAAHGLGADLAVAAAAFVGTNIDNCLVTTAMVARAPVARAHRIAAGQVAGFALIVAGAVAGAILLFEFSAAVVGLLGLVPLAIGLHGLWELWRARRQPGRDRSGGDAAGLESDAGAGGGGGGAGSGPELPAAPAAPTAAGAEGAGRATARTRRRGRGRAVDRAVGRSFTAAFLVTVAAGGDNLAVYIPLFRVGGATNLAVTAGVFVVGEAAVTALVLWGGRHPRARGVMTRVGHVAVPVLFCVLGIVVMAQAGTFGLL